MWPYQKCTAWYEEHRQHQHNQLPPMPRALSNDYNDNSMLCRRVVTKDRRYITQITCYERGQDGSLTRTHTGTEEEVLGRISGALAGGVGIDDNREGLRLPIFGGGSDNLATLFEVDRSQLQGGGGGSAGGSREFIYFLKTDRQTEADILTKLSFATFLHGITLLLFIFLGLSCHK